VLPKEGVIDMDKPLIQTMLRYTADGGEEIDMQMYHSNLPPGWHGQDGAGG
jgi:hypothetical protein